jgi:hypothetical protein
MRIILSVVDPEYPEDIQVEEISGNRDLLKAAIKLAEKNGLYYYFILRLKELNVDISFLEEERGNKEKQKLLELKETIMLLNKVSNDYGIDYILIKACNTIPHIPRDVDIFVHKGEKRKIIGAIGNNGTKCVRSDIAQTTLKKEKYLETDIYTGIRYFGVDFLDEKFLWTSNVKRKIFGIVYPGLNAEADFLLTLIHSLFGHRVITLLDFLHIKLLRDNIRDIDLCRKYAYEKGWGKVFDLVLNELDTIHRRIYKEGELIHFPHLFGTNFILKCVSMVDGLYINKSNKIFLRISLILDRVIYRLKDSALYNLLKSFEPTRKFLLSVIIWFEEHGRIKTAP